MTSIIEIISKLDSIEINSMPGMREKFDPTNERTKGLKSLGYIPDDLKKLLIVVEQLRQSVKEMEKNLERRRLEVLQSVSMHNDEKLRITTREIPGREDEIVRTQFLQMSLMRIFVFEFITRNKLHFSSVLCEFASIIYVAKDWELLVHDPDFTSTEATNLSFFQKYETKDDSPNVSKTVH